jgi:hypothetical protein
MPADDPDADASDPPTDAELARRFGRAGAWILVVGLGCAAFAYWRAVPDRDRALIAVLNNTKQYEYQMEQMGGKANLLATELYDWFADQFQGTHLARTLTVLSVGASGACFFVAHRLAGRPRAAGT